MTHVIAKIATKNSLKKKISIGRAECISLNTEVKCGGVVANGARTSLDVSLASTNKRMRRLTYLKTKIKQKKTKRSNLGKLDADVV